MADWKPPESDPVVPTPGAWKPPTADMAASQAPADSGYTGSILPFRRDASGLHFAVPEAIAAPVRGAIEGGERMLGIGEAGKNPLRPLDPDTLSTLMATEFGRAAGPRLDVGPPATTPKALETPGLQVKASQKIAARIDESAKTGGPTAADIMEEMGKARTEGQPATLADVGGRPVQRLAGEVYRGPGGAAAHLKGFFEGRDAALTPNLDTAAGARLGGINQKYIAGGSRLKTAEDLAAARSVNARPLWDRAMSHAPVWGPRLQQFLDHPDIQEGLRRGWKLERRHALAEGRPMNATDYAVVDFNEAGDPVFGKVPTMKMIQMAKEGLDDLMEAPGMRDTIPPFRLTKAGRSVDAVRRAFLEEGDRLNPDWAAAREQWSGDTQSMRALQDGRNLFDRRLTEEETKANWDKLSENDKQFYLIGVADRLQQILGSRALGADESKVLLNSASSIKRLRMIFGDRQEDFDKYLAAVLRERTMFETKHDVMGGSQTAERGAADERIGAGIHAAHGAAHLAAGNPLAAIGSTYRAVRDLGLRQDPALNAEIARQLSNPSVPLYYGPGGTATGPYAINKMLDDILGKLPP